MPDNTDNNQQTPTPQEVQTTTSDLAGTGTQLAPEQSAAQPSTFQTIMSQDVQNAQPNSPNAQPNAGTQQPTPQPDPIEQARAARDRALELHPAVAHASLARKVATTLAGGQQYREKIADDGSVVREPIPMSSKDLLRYSLANILSGLGQTAENFAARRAGRAPAPIQPLPSQVAQQQRNQQSQEDFERQQQAKVQAAKVLTANMEAMRAAYSIGKEDDAVKDSVIANHAPDLEQWNKSGAVEASNIPSSQLMSKGFDKSKYIAIPDGKVPAIGPDGTQAKDSNGVPLSELTYSVVDGTTQTPLTQDKYSQFAKYGLMHAKEGFNLPQGATISSANLALMNHKLDLYNQTQRELDEVAPGKINLSSELKGNKSLANAVELFHNDAASQNPIDQLNNMKTSQDPKVRAAAGVMTNLIGQKNLDEFAAKTQQPPDTLTMDKAQQIVSDPRTDKNSPAYKTASAFIADTNNRNRQLKRNEKSDELDAQRAIENGDLGTAAKNIVAGNVAQMKDLASFRGDQKARLYNMITDEAKAAGKDPKDYSPAKLEAKAKVLNDFSDGKAADNIMAFNTFLQHGSEALDATAAMRAQAGSPLINRPLNWIRKNAANDPNFTAFQTALIPVRKEYMNFLNNNRAEHEQDLKVMDKVLSDDSTPAQIESSLKQLGESADARLRELGRKYSNTMGEEYPNLIAPEGQAALQKMGVQSSLVQPQPNQPNVQRPAARTQNVQAPAGPLNNRVVPAGAIPGRDAKGNIIGYKTADGKVVTF